MKKVVHLETKIYTTFGIVDSEKDEVQRVVVGPVNTLGQNDPFTLSAVNKETLEALLQQVNGIKSQIQSKLDADEKETT